ncbi:dTDP-glucose 4,6-dehydratase [Prochlorococcus sp. AH-736-E15]|nr:dTDP-glucose 4,6-dehydratase [Prochlorococcus sp. AH-736-E15]
MRYFITGGAGFIGSALIRKLFLNEKNIILNYDNLTYSSNLNNLKNISKSKRYLFVRGDINDGEKLFSSLNDFKPDIIMNLAAETHVDRSITNADKFIKTNICGTYNLLNIAHKYWLNLSLKRQIEFRFHHISTDEVYGSLSQIGKFSESNRYDPSSPYSASKASSDHLVNAWFKTYNLPILITNCSNNYGPYQYPEKLIPKIILNAINKKNIPIYGNGNNIRDWLFVDDHVEALLIVIKKGIPGETYNIGGNCEKKNIEVANLICDLISEYMNLRGEFFDYKSLIKFVNDRPGHDFRYAIDSNKISNQLGWKPVESFGSGIKKTIDWYLNNLEFFK